MDTRPVLILGMHRSGTSCLAGSLQERGLHLGTVYESRPHNRKGNRENQQVMDLNNAVLACSGGAWDRPPVRLAWDAACIAARSSIVSELAGGSDGGAWGFKDPRTLLTLPFWLEAMPDARFVGTVRHPLHVARSLCARDPRMTTDAALDLWLAYNRRLLDLHRAAPFPMVDFDAAPDGYARQLDAMARHLGLDPRAGTFFEDALRTPEPLAGVGLPDTHVAVHAALLEAAGR